MRVGCVLELRVGCVLELDMRASYILEQGAAYIGRMRDCVVYGGAYKDAVMDILKPYKKNFIPKHGKRLLLQSLIGFELWTPLKKVYLYIQRREPETLTKRQCRLCVLLVVNSRVSQIEHIQTKSLIELWKIKILSSPHRSSLHRRVSCTTCLPIKHFIAPLKALHQAFSAAAEMRAYVLIWAAVSLEFLRFPIDLKCEPNPGLCTTPFSAHCCSTSPIWACMYKGKAEGQAKYREHWNGIRSGRRRTVVTGMSECTYTNRTSN